MRFEFPGSAESNRSGSTSGEAGVGIVGRIRSPDGAFFIELAIDGELAVEDMVIEGIGIGGLELVIDEPKLVTEALELNEDDVELRPLTG